MPRALFLGTALACAAPLGCSGSDSGDASDAVNHTSATNTHTSNSVTHGASTGASATTSDSAGPATTGSPGANTAATTSSTGGANVSSNTNTSAASGNTTTAALTTTTGAGGATAGTGTTLATAAGTTGSGGSGTSGGSVFPPSVTTPRIMIVGDSISAGPGCYKKYLVENLVENGITDYEFVGEYDDDCGGGVKHSAVSCTTSDQYTQASFTVPNCFPNETFSGMATLVQTHDPDLIMLQLGVNDVWGGSAPIEPILANYATLVEQARAHNPNIVVVVAQIHKIITDNCQNAASTANAEALVMAVPGWAETVTTSKSPVLVADLWTNSDAQEADDCVHPNDAGARRMGLNWYNALADILR